MIRTFIVGRLTKDIETKSVGDKTVANFDVATAREYDRKQTDYFHLVAWGKSAENLAKYCNKGTLIYASCIPQCDHYEDKSGNKREIVKFIVEKIEWVKDRNATTEKTASSTEDAVVAVDEGDMPF